MIRNYKQNILLVLITVLLFNTSAFAAESRAQDLGDIFQNLGKILSPFAGLIFSLSTVSGLAFGVAAALKFKQFKDNPQQITIGQPVGLFFLSVLMLWLPFLIQSIGSTLTGESVNSSPTADQSVLPDEQGQGGGSGLNKFRIK